MSRRQLPPVGLTFLRTDIARFTRRGLRDLPGDLFECLRNVAAVILMFRPPDWRLPGRRRVAVLKPNDRLAAKGPDQLVVARQGLGVLVGQQQLPRFVELLLKTAHT